jgi:hypothetical protein
MVQPGAPMHMVGVYGHLTNPICLQDILHNSGNGGSLSPRLWPGDGGKRVGAKGNAQEQMMNDTITAATSADAVFVQALSQCFIRLQLQTRRLLTTLLVHYD